jgi:predicted dehydrogenase
MSGSRVVGIVGTSELSIARAAGLMKDDFGFDGIGYTSVREMLETESPDIVAVTSPYTCHRGHAMEAVASGAHVLCEKPLVWDESHSFDRILGDARDLILATGSTDAQFGMTAQYPASLPMYRELYERDRGALETIETFEMKMEVKRRGERRLFERNWIDVASHPVSLVIAFLGRGEIDWGSAECLVEEAECRASFEYKHAAGRAKVSFEIRDIAEGVPLRQFGVNGFCVDWDGYADADGIYRAVLKHHDQQVNGEDFLHAMIGGFTDAVLNGKTDLIVGGADALLNLEHQVDLLRLARESTQAA